MKKYLAKMLRRAAQKLDPQDAPLFAFQLPNTTSAASTITYYEVR
jgi:hypothetical protein